MKLKGGTCPECGSARTSKEKIMGSDTGDIICLDCRYTDNWGEFHKSEKEKNEDTQSRNFPASE